LKVAVVYNRDSERVINLFGLPNREKYGKAAIKRITDALKKGGYQVKAFEGDKDIIDRLEEFMPRVVKGERPGMVFNLSYGIQGQARYTHIPSILEMVGIPYVGSGPEAHSLSLDKFVAKMIFRQNGVPTPEFTVLHGGAIHKPDLEFPLIVKPRNEAVSYGIRIVNDEDQLKEAAENIFEAFQQPVLVERYIEGREINVGLLGNGPPEVFRPAEILFGEGGPAIYTYEDKIRKSGRDIGVQCPARLDPEMEKKAQKIALDAFAALGCYDCARVDMRVDSEGNIYVLEINSLPSMGEHGSYVHGAQERGLDFQALVNKLVEVATQRYFGFKGPAIGGADREPHNQVFSYLVENRDQMETRLSEWVGLQSRTSDPVGLAMARKEIHKSFKNLGLKPVMEYTDERVTWAWETSEGFKDGTLLVAHVDVPLGPDVPAQEFRREPERLYGEGIGASRSALVMIEFALKALRRIKKLSRSRLGVILYTDEGRDGRYSSEIIASAAGMAKRMLVLRPSLTGEDIITRRRGIRTYWLSVDGSAARIGQALKKMDALRWSLNKLQELSTLSSAKERVSVLPVDIKCHRAPMRLPHSVHCALLVTYPDAVAADEVYNKIRSIFGKDNFRWRLELVSDRPPMVERNRKKGMAKDILSMAKKWDIPVKSKSSAQPSAAGLAPLKTDALCGLSPGCDSLYTQHESIDRNALVQRTLLLAQYLLSLVEK
jgi:D-alanine-D-alanine ligase